MATLYTDIFLPTLLSISDPSCGKQMVPLKISFVPAHVVFNGTGKSSTSALKYLLSLMF